MMILGMAVAALVWLVGKRRLLLGLLRYPAGPNSVHWRKEVWPFQWRIAISWISGYFVFQLFNPVLFAFKGPVAAGQMGMSLSIATALQAVAISWINTKAAPFGTMIARKEYGRLDQLFFQALKQSISVFALGALMVWLGSLYMNWAHIRFGQRILSPTALGILLLATSVNIIVFSEGCLPQSPQAGETPALFGLGSDPGWDVYIFSRKGLWSHRNGDGVFVCRTTDGLPCEHIHFS